MNFENILTLRKAVSVDPWALCQKLGGNGRKRTVMLDTAVIVGSFFGILFMSLAINQTKPRITVLNTARSRNVIHRSVLLL